MSASVLKSAGDTRICVPFSRTLTWVFVSASLMGDGVRRLAHSKGDDGGAIAFRGREREAQGAKTSLEPMGKGHGVVFDEVHAHTLEVVEAGPQLVYRPEGERGVLEFLRGLVEAELPRTDLAVRRGARRSGRGAGARAPRGARRRAPRRSCRATTCRCPRPWRRRRRPSRRGGTCRRLECRRRRRTRRARAPGRPPARMSWRKPFWCDTQATDTSLVRRSTRGSSSFVVTAPPRASATAELDARGPGQVRIQDELGLVVQLVDHDVVAGPQPQRARDDVLAFARRGQEADLVGRGVDELRELGRARRPSCAACRRG